MVLDRISECLNCTVDPRWSLEEIYTPMERVSRTCRGLKTEQSREAALAETGSCQGNECLLVWHWERKSRTVDTRCHHRLEGQSSGWGHSEHT